MLAFATCDSIDQNKIEIWLESPHVPEGARYWWVDSDTMPIDHITRAECIKRYGIAPSNWREMVVLPHGVQVS